jgi:hypothetical protein
MAEFGLHTEFSSLVKVTHGETDLDTHCNVPREPYYVKIREDTKLENKLGPSSSKFNCSRKIRAFLSPRAILNKYVKRWIFLNPIKNTYIGHIILLSNSWTPCIYRWPTVFTNSNSSGISAMERGIFN